MNDHPNPGSDEAVKLGCTCPVMDNAHGRGLPGGGFWINGGCPVHAPYVIPPKNPPAPK